MFIGTSTIKRIFKEGSDIKNVRVSDEAVMVVYDSLIDMIKELGKWVAKETDRKTIQQETIKYCVDKYLVFAGLNSHGISDLAPDRKTMTCEISENSARHVFNEGCPIKNGKKGYRMNGLAMDKIRILIEFYILKLSKEASVMAKHAKRQTITAEDIITFLEIRNRVRNDYNYSLLERDK